MNGLVKNVFLLIMGVIAAFVLYILLFGATGWTGNTLEMNESTGFSDRGTMQHWRGALWYAAIAIEKPISRYYQMYCLVPNMHLNDYVDEELGATLKLPMNQIIANSPANLKPSVTNDSTVQNWSHAGPMWDTGWR